MTSPSPSVGVVGLGKLGLPFAALLASKGVRVVGIDTSPPACEVITRRCYRGAEPGVAALLHKCRSGLTATSRFADLSATEMAFVIVPTPSDAKDHFSSELVLNAVRHIAAAVCNARVSRYTIVIVSTVMPGACNNQILPAVEHLTRGSDTVIDLVYSPEFVALGSVVWDMQHPDFVLIGSESAAATHQVMALYRRVVSHRVRCVTTNLVNAELAKLGVNTAIAFKITLANQLAALCESFEQADVDSVTAAVGADSRIGLKYLRGGLGFGGPCLPRDVRALAAVCRDAGLATSLPSAVTEFNERVPRCVVEQALGLVAPQPTVAVLGLSYTAGTPITHDSQAVRIVELLVARHCRVTVYDPLITRREFDRLAVTGADWAASAEEAIAAASLVIVATQAPEFRIVDYRLFEGKAVFDCWRWLAERREGRTVFRDVAPSCRYVPLGAPLTRGTGPANRAAMA